MSDIELPGALSTLFPLVILIALPPEACPGGPKTLLENISDPGSSPVRKVFPLGICDPCAVWNDSLELLGVWKVD